MKPSFSSLFVLALGSVSFASGQTAWNWQNPFPQGNTLNSVVVFSPSSILAVGEAGTFLRTTDAGVSWTRESSPTMLARALGVAFVSQTTGFVIGESTTGEGTILKTTDGGQSWNLLPTGPFTPLLTSLSFVSTTTGWVVGEGGTILRTTNGGADWIRQDGGTLNNLNAVSFAAITEGNVSTYEGIAVGEGGTVLTSLNGGATWSLVSYGTVTFYGAHYTPDVNYAVGSGGAILRNGSLITPSPTTRTLRAIRVVGTTVIAIGDNGTILRSTNNGVNWSLISSGTNQSLRALHFVTTTDGYIVGANGTILRTSDGGASWTILTRGFMSQLNSIAAHRDRSVFIVGNSGLMLKTTNDGGRWDSIASTVTQNLQGLTLLGDTIVVAGGGRILRSTDKGSTWNVRSSGVFNAVHLIPTGFGIAVGTGGAVLRTMDAGATWDSLNAGTAQTLNKVFVVDEFRAVAVGNDGVLLRTTDRGQTWAQATRDTALALYDVIFVNPSRGFAAGGTVAPGLPPVLLRTLDTGKTWQAVNLVGVVAGQTLRSLFFLNADTGYASGSGGLLIKTTDGGNTWMKVPSGTHQTLMDVLFLDSTTGFAVGTNGALLSTLRYEPTSVPVHRGNPPSGYGLWPNFPNPFNPATTIRFAVPHSGHVRLTVFNILGEEVSTLYNGDARANEIYSVVFNAQTLPSGVFYYQLRSGSSVQTRGMILIR